ncbi:MAG: hypothetical protein FWG19_02945 [Methanomassiliicoccaceae archaeon]|nr:hypothetical protein [Methanomassiliicoccaceae archaeon]
MTPIRRTHSPPGPSLPPLLRSGDKRREGRGRERREYSHDGSENTLIRSFHFPHRETGRRKIEKREMGKRDGKGKEEEEGERKGEGGERNTM